MEKRKDLPIDRFVADDVTEAMWLRLRRLSSVQLCKQIVERHRSTLAPEVVASKAEGMSSAIRSALGYWDTKEGGLNSRILSRYYALLQITIAEQISSSDPDANLASAQRHTEYGHGLFTLATNTKPFLANYHLGCLRSGHFPAYAKSLGHAVSAYASDKRYRVLMDADQSKLVTLADLVCRVPEFQGVVREYIGKDPLSFHVVHSQKNMALRSQRMQAHAQKTGKVEFDPPVADPDVTTYVSLYLPEGSSTTADELNAYGFEMKNICHVAATSAFDRDHFEGEIVHPNGTQWYDQVEIYKSGYCGSSVIVPFWGSKDPLMLHLTILYAFSIIVRYLPETWHSIEHGPMDHIRALLEHYLVVVDHVLPKIAIERLTHTRLSITQPGSMSAPI